MAEELYQLPNGEWVSPLTYADAAKGIAKRTNPFLPFSQQQRFFEGPLKRSTKPRGSPYMEDWALPAAAQQEPPEDDSEVRARIAERVKAQQAARRTSPFATNVPMMNHGASGAYHAAVGAQQQANALQNMIQQSTSAWQDEHDSRVAWLREMRRMEHERMLKQMELDALLARLDQARQASGPQPKAVFRGGVIY